MSTFPISAHLRVRVIVVKGNEQCDIDDHGDGDDDHDDVDYDNGDVDSDSDVDDDHDCEQIVALVR